MARKGSQEHGFKTHSFPKQCARLDYRARFTTYEMTSICEGLLPEEMEDKWLVVFTEDDGRVRFYRSWTGYCIYEMGFLPEVDSDWWLAHDVRVSRDQTQYQRQDDDEDIAILDWIVRNMLLGQHVEAPFGNPLQAWSEFGSASLGTPSGDTPK